MSLALTSIPLMTPTPTPPPTPIQQENDFDDGSEHTSIVVHRSISSGLSSTYSPRERIEQLAIRALQKQVVELQNRNSKLCYECYLAHRRNESYSEMMDITMKAFQLEIVILRQHNQKLMNNMYILQQQNKCLAISVGQVPNPSNAVNIPIFNGVNYSLSGNRQNFIPSTTATASTQNNSANVNE